MNDFIALIMIIVVYFLPYFFIFTLIKLSAGSLGKIQAGLDSINAEQSQVVKDSGRVKSFRENAKKSGAESRKQKNLDKIARYNTTLQGDDGSYKKTMARLGRANARSSLGTLGASGAFGRQLAGQEREGALKNSKVQIQEDMQDHGITDYDDQLDYQVALAKGQATYVIKNGSRAGATVEVKSYGDFGKQAAAESVMHEGKADRIRDIRTSLAAQGAGGERVWADAMKSEAGTVVKVAADVAGKPVDSLRASELATQDPATLRNIAHELDAAIRAGDTSKAQRLVYAADELRKDQNTYVNVNQDEFVIRMGSSLQQMLVDPEARTAASANATTLKGYKAHLTRHLEEVATRTHSEGATAGYLTLEDHISSDGTIK
jgi:hypothetical protein